MGASQRALTDALQAARAAWPALAVNDEVFLSYLEERAGSSDALAKLHVGDLYLACACGLGQPMALAEFERAVLPLATGAVARTRPAAHFEQDLKQVVRSKLFVKEGSAPARIARYAGRGPLVHWVRAVATRAALNMERGAGGPQAGGDELDLEQAPLTGPDPELQALRGRYREPFKVALKEALQALSSDERTFLRLHFVEGLSHEQIARTHRVHQTTVTRRIAAARAQLLEGVREYLAKHLKVPRQELSSLVRLVRSELEVSLGALMPSARTRR